MVYVCGEEEPVKAFRLIKDNGPAGWKFESTDELAFSNETAPYPGAPGDRIGVTDVNFNVMMPGGILSLSANAAAADPGKTGILWVSTTLFQSANRTVTDGVLRAFDASNFVDRPGDPKGRKRLVQIWSSDTKPADNVGLFAKFCPPIVADGKVFLPAFNEEVIGNDGIHRLKPGGRQAALVIYGLR